MKKILTLVFSTLLFAPLMLAQHETAGRASRRILTDDDDGKVEAWKRGEITSATPGEASIRRPLLQVIFAGAGWPDSAKEAVIADLRRLTLPDGIRPPVIAGSRDLPAPATLNDLGIHSMLNRGFEEGALSARDADMIHVVFLAPGIVSTLGASKPGADYDSYHSHVHMHDMNVRYVVVPWSDHVGDAAANSALRAVLNPDGE